MIIRNINQEEVQRGLYLAHGGATAAMLLDDSVLQCSLFMAHAVLKPGRVIELHADPYEEVYYLLQGRGVMTVGDEEERVRAGDAVWLPYGVSHALRNDGDNDCVILVTAAMPR
jgi:quercetin dioxygenase-like cupin family protein